MEPVTVDEFGHRARAVLPAEVWDFVQGGSGSEWTLGANLDQFDRIALRPSVLADVSACDTSTNLFGESLAVPLGVAPMAYHRLAHPDGEVATARAAGRTGALFIAGIFASRTLEEIADAATGPLWLQLYWLRQRDVLLELVDRAAAAGYQALVLTVDAPRVARRLRDVRNSFTLPEDITAVNIDHRVNSVGHYQGDGVSAVEAHAREQFDPTITWSDLEWLRTNTGLPLLLKGILTAEDAARAVDHGIDGIIVSNHGGRQLDGAVPTIAALPEVVDAVPSHVPVLLDGGVRRGTDVVKALSMGARTVLVGRPILWGLAYGGASGAAAVLDLLREELEEAMALLGRPTVPSLTADAVIPWPPLGSAARTAHPALP